MSEITSFINGQGGPIPVSQATPLPVALTGAGGGAQEVEIKNDSGNPLPVNAVTRQCVGRQTISVTTGAAVSLTVPANAVAALIQVDGASSCSITLEGTTPTASVGMRLDDGVFFYVDSGLSTVRLIARTATTNVHVAYFDRA